MIVMADGHSGEFDCTANRVGEREKVQEDALAAELETKVHVTEVRAEDEKKEETDNGEGEKARGDVVGVALEKKVHVTEEAAEDEKKEETKEGLLHRSHSSSSSSV